MTGYGRAEASGDQLAVTVECKSLNHRHLDVVIKLPRGLAALELEARRMVQGAVQRGRVEVAATLSIAEGAAASAVEVNLPQAREYLAAARRLGAEADLPEGRAWSGCSVSPACSSDRSGRRPTPARPRSF